MNEIFLDGLTGFYAAYDLRVWVITELGVLPDGKFGDVSKPFIECTTVQEALDLSRDWAGVAITFMVQSIHESMAFHVWREGERTNVCLYIAVEMVWYQSSNYKEGEWLLKFLEELCLALNADCCGFGRDPEYDFVYQPLERSDILQLLRSGRLFEMHRPVIHVIAENLISSTEIRELMRQYPIRDGLQFRKSDANYVLSNFRSGEAPIGDRKNVIDLRASSRYRSN